MRKPKTYALILAVLMMLALAAGCSNDSSNENEAAAVPSAENTETTENTDTPENTSDTSDSAETTDYDETKISFENEDTGIELVGILFTPTGTEESEEQTRAILVTGSLTSVKEQMQSIYARRLAELGYVTMVFDHTYYGESGGEPRRLENPTMKDSDIKSAVSYLESLPYVDGDKIAGVGICGGGGQMAYTASTDSRIKAIGAVVPYGIGVDDQYNMLTDEQIAELEAERDAYERGEAEPEYAGAYPAPYYTDPERGGIPEFDNIGTVTWSTLYFGDYDLKAALQQLEAPMLIISPEQQLSDTAERMEELSGGPTEYHFIEGSNHFDHYDLEPNVTDNVNLIDTFFKQNLQ